MVEVDIYYWHLPRLHTYNTVEINVAQTLYASYYLVICAARESWNFSCRGLVLTMTKVDVIAVSDGRTTYSTTYLQCRLLRGLSHIALGQIICGTEEPLLFAVCWFGYTLTCNRNDVLVIDIGIGWGFCPRSIVSAITRRCHGVIQFRLDALGIVVAYIGVSELAVPQQTGLWRESLAHNVGNLQSVRLQRCIHVRVFGIVYKVKTHLYTGESQISHHGLRSRVRILYGNCSVDSRAVSSLCVRLVYHRDVIGYGHAWF